MSAPSGELPPVVVLAAGKSSRMGVPKGLVEVGSEPWLLRQLSDIRACGVGGAIVVLGYARDEYVAALPWLFEGGASPWADFHVEVAINGAPERGPFSSLVTGCSRRTGRAAFVLPIDVPCAEAPVWSALAAALTGKVDACVPTHDGRGGHPVLGSSRFLDALERIDLAAPEARLDEQLRRATGVTRLAVADARVRLNLNMPSDWATIPR